MLRTTATRSLLKRFPKLTVSRSSYSAASASSTSLRNVRSMRTFNDKKRPQALLTLARPTTLSLYATKSGPPYDQIDEKAEHKVAEKVIEADPTHVSADSSVRRVFEGSQKKDDEMLGGLKSDLETIKETFSLADVPKEPLYIGAAGVLPYAATSLSTVYLAWDINHAHATSTDGFIFSPETAHELLEIITPIQIGFGAVIISFLGAIHWGLEYAGYGGYHSYRRYMYGVIAPAVAWPTIFMPVEYALITQFFAFNFMYFADARATVRGWFPAWYSTYRFVLTFFVGASIVATLVGRGQIVRSNHSNMKNPIDFLKGDRDSQWEALEREEKERRLALTKVNEEAEKDDKDESAGESEGKENEEDEDDSEGDDKKVAKKEGKEKKTAEEK